MSELGAYTFLPWLRQGIANKVDAADLDPAVRTRAAIDVRLSVAYTPVGGGADVVQEVRRDIELYGPGDVIGIEPRAIVKVEPRDWITNFETNYIPYIDFYDEDFPWRYTPAAPGSATPSRLRPWIMLVVLAEDEFTDAGLVTGRPLPAVTVDDPAVFPPSGELWAWAHVHVNESLVAGEPVVAPESANAAVLAGLADVLATNPDLAYSRILAPRRLAENTAYHAFLMPVFETGRLAGLGLDPAGAPFATHCAWDPYPNPGDKPETISYPFYHRWYFRTGTVGDFEYLVRLLEPQPMDARVGRRDMDVLVPGSNLPGIDEPGLGGVLRLGGALQVPFDALDPVAQQEETGYEEWDEPYPHTFQTQLAALVNLADDYHVRDAAAAKANPDLPQAVRDDPDPDPMITPPLYGRWHAKTARLLKDGDGNTVPNNRNWVHELNLDPRFRVAAGFGTEVVKANQESYMDAAWVQVGEIIRANQQIRQAQLAKEVSHVWHATHLAPLRDTNADRFLAVTAPLDGRVLVGGTTRRHTMDTSLAPRVVVSAPMRRAIRPRSRIVTRLGFSAQLGPEAVTTLLNQGDVVAAPPKVVPPALPTVDDVADELEPSAPAVIVAVLRRLPWLPWLLLVLALLAVLAGVALGFRIGFPAGTAALAIGLAVAAVAVAAWRYLRRIGRQARAADSLRPPSRTPAAVDELANRPRFVLTPAGFENQPSSGDADSADAIRFKAGLSDAYSVLATGRQVAVETARTPMDLTATVDRTFQTLDADIAVVRRSLARIHLPPRIVDAMAPEIFVEAMAYPHLDMPMYQPLAAISAELLLPNLQFVPQNSISLLETNQRFIEAYLVGLNHEFARELLWREYPTDQRGSYFRQFWDVSTFLDPDATTDEAQREKLLDIPPLHRWSVSSALGDHDNRELPGDNEDELVLVVRGELLKKYPTAVIYAQRAVWTLDEDGEIDRTQPRQLVTLTDAEAQAPPPAKVRSPLYEAKLDPDIYFFGFDLTVVAAKGESAASPDDPGWFFVIEERPGEPRFGFDIEQGGGVKHYWNDLSWSDVLPDGTPGDFLRPATTPAVTLTAPPASATPDQQAQHEEDEQVTWDSDVSAAELAYIAYQVPVLVAVHAAKMLPE